MKLHELTTLCYQISSVTGLGCSGYLLVFMNEDRSFLRTFLLLGWTLLSGISVLKMIGELIIDRLITHKLLGGIKERLIEKVHSRINKKLTAAFYILSMLGIVMVKIGVPFLINNFSLG